MRAEIVNVDGLTMMAKSDTNHWVVMDTTREGQVAAAATPMETFLFGFGGCFCMTVKSLLLKKRLDVSKVSMRIDAQRAPEPPTVFTKIDAVLELSGSNLRDADVEWAVALAREKYCQVDVMLEKAVPIDVKWEILE
ncbi:MAG TPA: OsmC family protein [Bacillota bacterium]|jgi:putative redox protein|nr:OsmC family protein [Bacillota bacterium]